MEKIYDLLIQDALIFDGTLRAPFKANIGIKGHSIEAVGQLLPDAAAEVISAQGLTVCPGFIDIHSHSDFSLLIEPWAHSKVFQGVTTEVIGNCGSSAGPLAGPCLERARRAWTRHGLKVNWTSLGQYLSLLEERGIAVNVVPLVGHGTIRASTMGYEATKPTEAQGKRMKALFEEALTQGAWGLSSGLIYSPGFFSTVDEIIALLKAAPPDSIIYATHMRDEGPRVVEAVEEALKVAQETGISLQISHLKTSGEENWGKLERLFHLIEKARARGFRVNCDRYPYIASNTDLDSILPSWAQSGQERQRLAQLGKAPLRARLIEDLRVGHPQDGYWQRVILSWLEAQSCKVYEGKSMEEVASLKGQSPEEAFLDLLQENRFRAEAIFFTMSEENLKKIITKDYVMLGSDASAKAQSGPLSLGKPHPRAFGTFPRFLGTYVREQGLMSWEEAIHKLCLLPAEKLGLTTKGKISPGMDADLVIFDPEKVSDAATYDWPWAYPEGIKAVLVMGSVVVKDGRLTGSLPGRAMRRNL